MKNYDLIRPKEIYKQVLEQREIDGRLFYKKYQHRFFKVFCPACGNKGKPVFNKYGFSHKLCRYCQTLYCSPRPDDDLLALYYNSYKAPKMWTKLLIESDIQRKILQYNPRVEKIVSILKKHGISRNGKALDVGAGSGAFSLSLKKSGFFSEVIAIDVSESCVRACKNQKLTAFCAQVKNMDDHSVGLVCMNDLIEHVFNPRLLLDECYRVLRKKGFLSIATPNGEGFDFKILKDKTRNITPPEHLTYFNPSSLKMLLEKCGFQVISAQTAGTLDVEMILKEKENGFALRKRNEYLDYLLSKEEKILKNFQSFISKNKLSSHMLIVAQKKKE